MGVPTLGQSVSAPPASLADSLRSRYTLERELGRGGMSRVYLARDLKHDRPVALKVLHPDLAATLGPERFLREVHLTASLQHPHILPVHDSGEAGGHLWYTMPYVDGESLRERLNREKQLPLEDTLQIARNVLAALAYAHSRGVVHRDIKPENVLLEAGEAVVADFGIARAISAAGGEHLTQTGMAVGTPAYMSPEQAAGGNELDGRSDLYSVGCVLYEMLAGEAPYTGPTPQAILAKRVLEPVPHLRTLRESVPEALEQVVTKALAKTPADRFQTAAQFGRALAAAVSASTTATTSLSSAAHAAEPRRRRAVVVTLLFCLIIGGGCSHEVSSAGRLPLKAGRGCSPCSRSGISGRQATSTSRTV
jgi:serine/threonine protein kinase